MKKYEAKELMIGSWVLPYDGNTPRQIVSLTMQKAGFMRDYGRGRDFYRFDQIQGIPLSEELLKNCVTYHDMNPKEPNEQVQSIHCYSDTVIAIHVGGETKYKRSATSTKSKHTSCPATTWLRCLMWRSTQP